jgi:hypothetical protein
MRRLPWKDENFREMGTSSYSSLCWETEHDSGRKLGVLRLAKILGIQAEFIMWIPDFLVKMFGRKLEDKLDLQEDSKMDDTKKWYQSKGIWTSVVSGLIGIYQAVSVIHPLPPIPPFVFTLLGAMGLYALRTADKTIE